MRRTLLIYEQTVEREGEGVWALWEEVASRGLDTWTELPAVCTPYQTAQTPNPAEKHTPCSGQGGRKVRALLCQYCRYQLEAVLFWKRKGGEKHLITQESTNA